ncbi:MAG TPA: hypothetical protein DCL61_09010, partial [Cyanobacteria bacterium UBA12227]|nr:hypothetical protein [Cyanobacteria bacterium UBA12227]
SGDTNNTWDIFVATNVETPGDTLATALNSGLSSANPGTFNLSSQIGNNPHVSPRSDVDMIAFQLNAGGRVTIDIDANQNGSPLDSVLRIFDSNGNQLAFSDDNAAPGEGASLDSYLNFTATQAGTYYVGVSGYWNHNYNPSVAGTGIGYSTGNYNLQMTVSETPGDTLATALNSGLSSANPGTFNLSSQIGNNPNVSPRSDVDMIAFQLDAGGRVTLDIDARINTPSSPLDSILRIFDSNGNQVAVSDDNTAPGEPFTFDSYLDFTAQQTGTYYVGVSSFANFSYNPNVAGSGTGGSTGNYNLQMNVLETPGDTLATARQSGLSSTNSGTFILNSRIGNNPNVSSTSDVDMIAFQVNAGGRVIVDIDARINGSPLDSVVRIFNSSGQQLFVSDDNTAPDEAFTFDSYLSFTATQTGTYYVGVSGYSNFNYNPSVAGSGNGFSTGNYNLQLSVVSNTISGTQLSNTLYGTSASEAIYGLAGNDTIYANEGNNAVYGGDGNDTLYAGNGNDFIDGGADNDIIYANEGNNTIYGGAGNDTLYGGNGNDVIDGGTGNDTIFANGGNNNITGGAGIDTIYAGNGNDVIDGGADNDTIFANEGNNTINGGAGNDTLYAGNGNDLINGDDGNDTIYANEG